MMSRTFPSLLKTCRTSLWNSVNSSAASRHSHNSPMRFCTTQSRHLKTGIFLQNSPTRLQTCFSRPGYNQKSQLCHQQRAYGRGPYQYQRFQQKRGYLKAWVAHPYFYYHIGGIAGVIGGVYVYNLETVPVSGRRRFNIVSPEVEASMSADLYKEVLRQYAGAIYPPSSNEHRLVQRILNRLLPHSGLSTEGWAVHVVHDPQQPNAFVIPGGKVVVFSGLIDLCKKGNDAENELAIVLGHEIAHNVARHAAERISQQFSIILPVTIITSILSMLAIGVDLGIGRSVASLALERPGSRAQESEADYIGLLMAASSCYDPSAALQLWQRMEDLEKVQGGTIPQFLSTHPSNHNRMEKIRSWLPEAEAKRDESGCATIGPYARDFRQLTNFSRW